jgi:DNA-binding IclR family transcriptional regulator
MQALELLAFQPLSAPQLATALGAHPRTARRMLRRLELEGYVRCSGDARRLYSLTLRLVALAGHAVERAALPRVGVPFVDRLHAETGATTHLAVPSYRDALCLVHANGSGRPRPHVGELVPAHCTAVGKALLGWRAPWRESVLSGPLERHTQRTVVDPARVRRDVDAARDRGYATEDEEFHSGVRAVAAPVFLAGEAVAALGVSGTDIEVGRLVSRVVTVAAELSQALEDSHS